MRVPPRIWAALSVAIFCSILAWGVGYVTAFRLISMLGQAPGIKLQARRWSTDLLGKMVIQDLRVQESQNKNTILEGDFLIRINPAEVWFSGEQHIGLKGTHISSNVLRDFLRSTGIELLEEIGLTANILLKPGKELTIRDAQFQMGDSTATLAGHIGYRGELDITSTWFLGRKVLDRLPGFLIESFSGKSSVERASPSHSPMQVQCVLQGDVRHPNVRVTSDLFQIELG